MRRGSQAPEKYVDISTHYGVPNEMVTYNIRVCTGKWWVSINHILYIETGLLVPITNIRIMPKVRVMVVT